LNTNLLIVSWKKKKAKLQSSSKKNLHGWKTHRTVEVEPKKIMKKK